MSFWDVVGSIVSSLMQEGQKRQSKAMDDYAKKVNEYERKLNKAERNISNLNAEQKAKIQQARQKLEENRGKMIQRGVRIIDSGQVLYGDKTVEQWNRNWQNIGPLETADLTPYNEYVGLYRHRLDGKIVYVGRAIELHNGGFRKRLSDYRRESDSARKHSSGSLIYDNLDRIKTDILIVGDTENAVEITKMLEGPFIAKYNPSWNKQINI